MPIKLITLIIFLLGLLVQNAFAADLFSAAKQGNLKLVEKLLRQGADANEWLVCLISCCFFG